MCIWHNRGMTESNQPLTASELIRTLDLQPHPEGGYFRRTFEAKHRKSVATEHGERPPLTSIYYLLTADSPIGHFHQNRSDILHFFHAGDPITYYLIDPATRTLTQHTLGNDLHQGQLPQLSVPGGIWKASALPEQGRHGFGLIGEAVSPGFDYADMILGSASDLLRRFPEHRDLIPRLSASP